MSVCPEVFIDRDLSWIDFNIRVLEEAENENNPILTRVMFAGIVSSNFDEFFMVRAAGIEAGDLHEKTLYRKAFDAIERQQRMWSTSVWPELERSGFRRITRTSVTPEQSEYLKQRFLTEIFPLLTPIALRPELEAQPLVNHSLYIIVKLKPQNGPGETRFAAIEIPRNLPRLISLEHPDSSAAFIPTEDIIGIHVSDLFRGYEIISSGLFRITRAADMTVDEEKDEDFAEIMSDALHERKQGYVTRLELNADEETGEFIKEYLSVQDHVIIRCDQWMDLKKISEIAFKPGFENLRKPVWTPVNSPYFESQDAIWENISDEDRYVHYPYESFDAFIRFLDAAADDPDVLSIKQTLYRAASKSRVISALIRAAESGKQVTVLVELKARFDEAANIHWAKRLEKSGATVLYGVAGLKTHAKACLVVRREVEGIRRYAVLATGNFNEKTARVYSDLALFTAKHAITQDVASFFNVITGFSQPIGFSRIEISPYRLRTRLERMIDREIEHVKEGSEGLIIAKMNALADKAMVEKLTEASQAGVKILLNVRGACCIKAGVKGYTDNISVISIIDMFLEHSRIYYFLNGGKEEVYLASADWMTRNFDRRLEILFPIDDRRIQADVKKILKSYFKDNQNAWEMQPDGSYMRINIKGSKPFRSQKRLCSQAQESEKNRRMDAAKELKPQTPKRR